jgi:hypothetical protein
VSGCPSEPTFTTLEIVGSTPLKTLDASVPAVDGITELVLGSVVVELTLITHPVHGLGGRTSPTQKRGSSKVKLPGLVLIDV